MVDNERLLERAVSTSSACLLPPLRDDIDAKPMAREDFKSFLTILDDQLHLLLDILYQNGNLLSDPSFDNALTQLRVNLLLVRCEQTAENQFFQTEQSILKESLASLTDKNVQYFDDKIFLKVIETYKTCLTKNCWKRQLGMIHSISKFCEIFFTKRPQLVNEDILLFLLSIGSNLAAHYDPYYKTIGLRIYNKMLKLCDKDLLKELNIVQVIYNESYSMLRKSNDLNLNEEVYESLFYVILIEGSDGKSSKWSKFDDVMSELLTQCGIEIDPSTSEVCLKRIVKFCAIDYQIEDLVTLETTYAKLSKISRNHENRRTMRWLKKLMEMMIRESARLINSSEDCCTVLCAYHCIYITTIKTLDSQIIGNQLIDFSKRLVVILLQVVSRFKNDFNVIDSIISLLKTIEDHQENNGDLVNCLRKVRNEIEIKRFR